jgi:hypothetical protein
MYKHKKHVCEPKQKKIIEEQTLKNIVLAYNELEKKYNELEKTHYEIIKDNEILKKTEYKNI